MLTLVLEGTIVLGLDVHVNSTLILLGELAVRALEVARLGTDIVEGHSSFVGLSIMGGQNSIFRREKKYRY
jgi:hypothetical protein